MKKMILILLVILFIFFIFLTEDKIIISKDLELIKINNEIYIHIFYID